MLGRCVAAGLRRARLRPAVGDIGSSPLGVRGRSSAAAGEVYEQGAKPPHPKFLRQYFYTIDEHGQLFMHDAKVKNFITAFKDKDFLDFFHRRIRPNDTGLYTAAFPFISPCGRELNFIEPVDSPLVFRQVVDGELVWGGTLRFPFDPNRLAISDTGRIYHPSPMPEVTELALIGSHLGIELGKGFVYADDGTCSLRWGDALYPIATLGSS